MNEFIERERVDVKQILGNCLPRYANESDLRLYGEFKGDWPRHPLSGKEHAEEEETLGELRPQAAASFSRHVTT